MSRGGQDRGPGDTRGSAFRASVIEVLFGREHSSLAGDIEEVYCRTMSSRGRAAASFWFWSQVLRALPHYAYNTIYWRSSMLANYLKVAFRVMKRQKSFTLINLAGLAAGMASCLLILLFIKSELSYDRHHENADSIYRVQISATVGGNDFEVASVYGPLAEAVLEELPEVLQAARFRDHKNQVFTYGDKSLKVNSVAYADPSVFDIFTIGLISGDPGRILTEPGTVVLSKSTAQRYFGGEDPIGRSVRMNDKENFTVTGVYMDFPAASHFHFDIMISMGSIDQEELTNWTDCNFYTYYLLDENADIPACNGKILGVVKKNLSPLVEKLYGMTIDQMVERGDIRYDFYLQPMTSIHLHSKTDNPTSHNEIEPNGDIRTIYIFSAVALIILLIATINFINLSTARASGRAREVGIRKVVGSSRKGLIRQFLTETIVLCVLAGLISILIVHMMIPWFNSISGKDFATEELFRGSTLLWTALTVLVTGLVSGFYPAVYLSSFEPAMILKSGSIASSSRGILRGVLVIAQLAISIILLSGMILVSKQLDFIRRIDPGYDAEQVIIVENTNLLGERAASFRDAIVSDSRVINGTVTGFLPIDSDRSLTGAYPDGDNNASTATNIGWFFVDADYISTFGMRIKEGRDFSRDFPSDKQAIVINEAAARQFGWDDPLEHKVSTTGRELNRIDYQVIGVVEDFHFASLHSPVIPLVMTIDDSRSRVSFRVSPADIASVLPFIESKWTEFAGDRPFEYRFLDDDFALYYSSEQRLGRIVTAFSSLAVIIGCMGLIGLASFMAAQRTKEIGVRKVLGASTGSIVYMLLREFSRWIVIANVIAIPVAWILMDRWLRNFAYRTEIGAEIFVAASALTLAVATLSVIWQVGRAASANPVRSLKYE